MTEWIGNIGGVVAIILGVSGVMGLAYRFTLQRRLDRIERATSLSLEHLEPNGHEEEAHPDDRDLPVRRLLHRLAREQRATTARLESGAEWMRGHHLEHVRHDPAWPGEGGTA